MTSIRRRRVRSLIVIVVVLVVFGGVAAVAQALSNKERVTSIWVGAVIRADGSARITEVIDYDFGHSGETHGIYRDVPDADFYDKGVRATMDGHKVPYEGTIGDSTGTRTAGRATPSASRWATPTTGWAESTATASSTRSRTW
ncbi:DUF2207 domain-containing protein [Streptomyces sp. NPDC001450]